MASPRTAELAALAEVQARTAHNITEVLLSIVSSLIRGFGGWYSSAEIAKVSAQLAAFAESAQRQAAANTDAYLSRAAGQISGRAVQPAGVIDVSGLRKNVTHPGAYARAADQWRYAVSQGASEAQALDVAVQRAEAVAGMDLALAEREQEHKFMVVRSVDGFRRIIHPEVVSSRSKAQTPGPVCGLCVVASDRLYHRDDLKELHDGCRCTVLPIINGIDPGREINRSDLDAIYRDAGSTAAAKLKRTKYVVHEHGELGPVLAFAKEGFRTPAEVADDARPAA